MAIFKNLKVIAFVGVGLVSLLVWKQFTIHNLEKEVLKKENEITKLEHNNEKLEDSILDQNKKVKDAENKAIEFQERFNVLNGDLNKQKEQSNKIIDALIDEKTPETCDEIAEYLLNGLEDITWLD